MLFLWNWKIVSIASYWILLSDSQRINGAFQLILRSKSTCTARYLQHLYKNKHESFSKTKTEIIKLKRDANQREHLQSINKNFQKFVTRLIVTPFKSDRHSQFYLSFGFLFQLFLWYFFAFIADLMFSQRIFNLKPNKMTVEVVNLCPIEAEIYYFFLP